MTFARIFVLIALYLAVCILTVAGLLMYSLGLALNDICFFVIASALALFQIALAVHLYWNQNWSEDEIRAIVIILENEIRRSLVKRINASGSSWINKLSRETGFHQSKVIANLSDLEAAGIITSRAEIVSGSSRALKKFAVSPKFRKLVRRISSNL